MSKKKNQINTLNIDEFVGLRTGVLNTELAQERYEHAVAKLKILELQAEIASMRLLAFRSHVGEKRVASEVAQKNYKQLKVKISERIEMPLEECLVDDYTLEVKRMAGDL